jgi:hypothetical protein
MRVKWIWIVGAAIYMLAGMGGQVRADDPEPECPQNLINPQPFRGFPSCQTPAATPEIDSSSWVTGLGFTSGVMLILRARRRAASR